MQHMFFKYSLIYLAIRQTILIKQVVGGYSRKWLNVRQRLCKIICILFNTNYPIRKKCPYSPGARRDGCRCKAKSSKVPATWHGFRFRNWRPFATPAGRLTVCKAMNFSPTYTNNSPPACGQYGDTQHLITSLVNNIPNNTHSKHLLKLRSWPWNMPVVCYRSRKLTRRCLEIQ